MKNKEIKVGILAIICGFALYFGFNFLKGEDFFSTTKKYAIHYDNIGGLTVSNPVIVNGFSVGRVKSIKLVEKDNTRKLKVVIDVRDDIPVGDSTVAILTSNDLLGGKAIILELGNSSKIYNTNDELKGFVERSITEELEMRARPVLNTLDTTLHNFSSIMDNENKQSIKNTLKNMERTSALIEKMAAENRRTFNNVGAQLQGIMEHFAETERKIAPLLEKAGVFTDSLNTLHLAETIRNVESAIDNLNAIMIKINSTDGTIGMMMNDKELYENINKTMSDLQHTLEHFEKNPKHFLKPLGEKPGKKDPYWEDPKYNK